MLAKKIRNEIIRLFLVSMTLFLSLIFLVCSKNKYPESYGVYLCENMNSIKRTELNNEKMFLGIDVKELPFSSNITPISLWFYDPKIVPTELKFGRFSDLVTNRFLEYIENIDFDTKPIDGKIGLFKIEIMQPLEEGLYSLYSYNIIKGSTIPVLMWPFLIATKKSKSSFKKEILGEWNMAIDIGYIEFRQNGEIWNETDKTGNYNFIGPDSIQLEFINEDKIKGKIYFISNQLLYVEFKEAPVIMQKLFLYRKN